MTSISVNKLWLLASVHVLLGLFQLKLLFLCPCRSKNVLQYSRDDVEAEVRRAG